MADALENDWQPSVRSVKYGGLNGFARVTGHDTIKMFFPGNVEHGGRVVAIFWPDYTDDSLDNQSRAEMNFEMLEEPEIKVILETLEFH